MAGELLEVIMHSPNSKAFAASQRNLTTNYWSLALATIR
jgi:hypothetical protein